MARLHRAVAEEHHRDRVVTAQPCGEGAPERDRDVAADDAGRAEEAVLRVDDVHRSAEALAQAGFAPHQLGQQPVERRALRDRVTVGPVPGVHRVVVAELASTRLRRRLPVPC